jgi:DNA topoisomerase VI subunit B
MNQRVVLLLPNLYSKGQALYHKTSSKKLPSQLSWFNPNQPASLEFDILPTYQNSTRRSVLSSFPIYNIERIILIVIDKLAESLSLIATRIYQNSRKPSNLVLLKSLNLRGPTTACFDKELKMIR